MVMNISVVIPTFNRLPILQQCLIALENQTLEEKVLDYEIIVVDDGSTDETTSWVKNNAKLLPHVVLYEQEHGGAARGRNLGVMKSKYEVIIFIDSDLVVLNDFILSHAKKLQIYWQKHNKKCFTYGSVINTSNFKNPESESFKLTDFSFAYFATGNVAISKELLINIGLFDSSFGLYGWEDLELGERLKKIGTKLIKCPEAVGFHWHPPFICQQIDSLVTQEIERAKMALVFYKKHSNFRVRCMIQFTPIHSLFWEVICFGGLLSIKRLIPLLEFLIKNGRNRLALEIIRIPLNYIYIKELKKLTKK